MTTGGVPGPGWYPDPWFNGQHRFWTGAGWTADVFPDGPTGAQARVELRPESERPPAPPPTERSPTPPPAPTFNYGETAPTTVFAPWETLESAPARSGRRLSSRQINIIALGIGLVVGFVAVAVALSRHQGTSDAAPPPTQIVPTAPAPTPSPTLSQPVDPDGTVLQQLVVRQQDVTSGYTVELLDGGGEVNGQTTLDLCNGNFPSEVLRTARLQVVEYDSSGDAVFSTEAVLYRTPADAGQAMQEVRTVASKCPDSPVVSPVNEPTVTTEFQQAPDSGWPHVDGVDRAAYAFTTTDGLGDTEQRIAVYLRRGRVLEGLYFDTPNGTQPAVQGQTSVAGIVHLFEERIAALPSSVTGG